MKGSVGTSTTIERIKWKKHKFKAKQKHAQFFCYGCRSYIKKGQWIQRKPNGSLGHAYRCKKND